MKMYPSITRSGEPTCICFNYFVKIDLNYSLKVRVSLYNSSCVIPPGICRTAYKNLDNHYTFGHGKTFLMLGNKGSSISLFYAQLFKVAIDVNYSFRA